MQTKIIWSWELPEYLDGIAVVCDVWAATTNINTLLAKEIGKLLIVNANNVIDAKERYKDALIIGESLKLPKTFFNTSNYPWDVAKTEAKNKTILYMSNNGSRIIEMVLKKGAKKAITVGFTNIAAINGYLKGSKENIYLIPSGNIENADKRAREDLICVEALDKLLRGENVDLKRVQEESKTCIEVDYANETFDRDLNFKIVFNLNGSESIPLCNQDKRGFIKVVDLRNRVILGK